MKASAVSESMKHRQEISSCISRDFGSDLGHATACHEIRRLDCLEKGYPTGPLKAGLAEQGRHAILLVLTWNIVESSILLAQAVTGLDPSLTRNPSFHSTVKS